MKLYILIFFLVMEYTCFSQSHWSSKEIEILNKYSLDSNDHRGVILKGSENAPLLKTVIEAFFSMSSKSDLTELLVRLDKNRDDYLDKPLDIHQLITLYIIIRE